MVNKVCTFASFIYFSSYLKVQNHFETYAKKVDQIVEEALRSNIKQCMTQLCRAVSGDNKTSPSPLFKVLLTLRQASPTATPKVQPQSHLAQAGLVVRFVCSFIFLVKYITCS